MGNDLRERLEALSEEASSGPWDNTGTHGKPTDFGVYAPQGRSICSTGGFADGKDITYRQNVANAQFIAAVSNAFRSGDLVTRSEMEEAVAKAVAGEREACLNAVEECAYTPDNDIEEAFVEGVSASEEAIRALRAEEKEREIKEDALRVLDIAVHHGGFVYPKHRMRAEEVLERSRSEQKEGE